MCRLYEPEHALCRCSLSGHVVGLVIGGRRWSRPVGGGAPAESALICGWQILRCNSAAVAYRSGSDPCRGSAPNPTNSPSF